jgi:hypothetical protein
MSLTKNSFLEAAKVSGPEYLGEFLGMKIWVKPCSELKRSRRGASMFDASGKVKSNYRERARAYSIIDSVCDENGKYLFDESDLQDLLHCDSMKLDPLSRALTDWANKSEGNETGESGD